MATPSCWRCLLRPTVAPSRVAAAAAGFVATPAASFSMSTPLAKMPTQNNKASGTSIKIRSSKFGAGKRKNFKSTGKSPLPGERKAFRKRIQLTNNNALPVEGLEKLTKGSLVDLESIGKVHSIHEDVVDQLRAVEAFKPTQSWGFFHAPHTLVRAQTVELAQKMQMAATDKDMLRMVISGEKISGKSILLLQAMAHAFMNDWVVINFPEAQELTTACTHYAPIPDTNPRLYLQAEYALNMLRQIRKASDHVLQKMTVLNKHPDLSLEIIPHASTLAELVAMGKEPDTAWPVLEALFAELQTPSPDRRPVLLALDGLAHIMRMSDYRSPAFEPIHSHDLALVRRVVDALSLGPGFKPFPAGGAVIAADSKGNSPKSFSVELALAQREAEQRKETPPAADPYCRAYDPRVDEALRTVSVIRTTTLNRPETRTLMEYWAASGVLRKVVDEKRVVDVWSLGGSGNVGEMERAALLNMKV